MFSPSVRRLTLLALFPFASSAIEVGAQQLPLPQPRNDAGVLAIKRWFNGTRPTNVPGVSCNREAKDCALNSAIWYRGRFWVLGRVGWCCATDRETEKKIKQ